MCIIFFYYTIHIGTQIIPFFQKTHIKILTLNKLIGKFIFFLFEIFKVGSDT